MAARSRKAAKLPQFAQTGWCGPGISLTTPPRPLHQRKLRDIFLDVAATPPPAEEGSSRNATLVFHVLGQRLIQEGEGLPSVKRHRNYSQLVEYD